jgi:hypothetical protein
MYAREKNKKVGSIRYSCNLIIDLESFSQLG